METFYFGVQRIFILFLLILAGKGAFAEGSKDLLTNGGHRAFFLSTTSANSNYNPYPTQGAVKVYVKAGETLYLGSSAQNVGSGEIKATTPNGTVYRTGTGTTLGKIVNRTQELAGPLPNSNGYNPYTLIVKPEEEGVWEINFISPSPNAGQSSGFPAVTLAGNDWSQPTSSPYIAAFDVTVKGTDNLTKNGRAYMNIFGACLGNYNIGFNAIFNILTKDGYQYEVDNNGQAGYIFAFFVNNKGFVDNTGKPIYKSVTTTNAPVHDPRSADTGTDITHKIFFAKPNSDLPASAPIAGGGSTWLLKQPASPSASDFLFTGKEGTLYKGGSYPLGGYISFIADQEVGYSIALDINQNGVFTDPVDRTIVGTAQVGKNNIYWDGLNGQGNPVTGSFSFAPQNMNIRLRGGEVHFPFTDVETNTNGMIIRRMNGPNSPDDKVYWNDSAISNGTSSLNGSSSTTNGHKWGNNFGDARGLDTWTYIESTPISPLMQVELRQADLQVVSIAATKTSYCIGEEITYNVQLKNNGPSDVTEAKFVLSYPSHFQFTGVTAVQTTGVSSSYGNSANATQFSTTVDMKNGAVLTLQIKGKTTAASPLNTVTASILRPKDVTDPDATNPDDAPPTDAAAECNPGCNNIKTAASLTINTVAIDIGDASVTEKTAALSNISFPVTITSVAGCDVSATYTITHITTNASDFDSSFSGTGTVTIPAGSRSATITIPVNADAIVEANETFRITLSNPVGGHLSTNFGTGTIINDDFAKLTITSTPGSETGTVAGKFIFNLSNVADVDTEIDYVLSGTLTAGDDFTGPDHGTIVIPAGQTTYTLSLPVIDDDIVEGDEKTGIAITRLYSAHTGTVSNSTTISPEVTVTDNDNATLNLSSDVVLNEGASGETVYATFTLSLSNPTAKKFTLNYRTEDFTAKASDNDYVASGTVSLEFNGLKNELKTITIPVTGDKKIEKDEMLKLIIFNLSDSFGSRLTIPKEEGLVTITNDDHGQISILGENGEEGVKSGVFTFKLPDGIVSDVPLTINYGLAGEAVGAGTDYTTPVAGTVTINAGENNAILVLPVVDDAIAEGTESVELTATIGLNSYNIGLANSTKSLSILDNDKALITINPVSVTEGSNGATTTASFEVGLNVATAKAFTVRYKTADGTAKTADADYVAKNGILEFQGTAGEKITVDVLVNADRKIEDDETFSVLLENLSFDFGGNLSIQNPASATGTIRDDDSGVITVTAVNGSENGPGNGSFLFSFPAGITSDKATRINFEIDGDAESAADYTPSAVSFVEIPAGQPNALLSLTVIDDNIVEGDEKVKLKNVALAATYPRISLNSSIPDVTITDNDLATLTLTGPADGNETSNGPSTVTFNLKLDKPVSKQFSIAYSTADGSATVADNDYVSASGFQVFQGLAGENYPITVTVNGDKKVEDSENFLLMLSGLSNNFGSRLSASPTQTSYLIKNDDNASIIISAAAGEEGSHDASITFSLQNDARVDKDITINYSLTGTAQAGLDYTDPSAGSVILEAGKSSVTVPILVIDDDILEETENIKVAVTSVLAGSYNIPVQNSPLTFDITDNDEATISVVSPVWVTEGNAGTVNLTFEVKLNKDISKQVSLKFKTVDGDAKAGEDYVAQEAQLSFLPLSWNTPQLISIPVRGDFSIEADESFTVNLFDLSESFGGRLKIEENSKTVTGRILNDDGGDIKITHKDGAEGGDTPEFIFSFPGTYTSPDPVKIEYKLSGSASSGTDYSGASSFITIPAGASSISLPLTVIDDVIVEGDEEIELNVISVSSNLTMSNSFDKLSIADNDIAKLTLHGPVTVTEPDQGQTVTASFKVSLDKKTSKGFQVSYATADGTAKVNDGDYIPKSGNISFSGNAGEEQFITVEINGDNKLEKDETFAVNLGSLSEIFKDSKGTERLGFGVKNTFGTIENNDRLSVEIGGTNGKEGSNPASFTFTLAGGVADEDISIAYDLTGTAQADSKDYIGATSGSVIIPAGLTSQSVTLPVVDDAILEDTESIILSARILGGSYPVALDVSSKTISIEDNDQALVTVTGFTVTEGNEGTQTANFTLSLNNETSAGFDIDFATADGSAKVADGDYVAKSGTRHFAGQAGEVQNIDVVINGDRKVEGNEAFNLLLSNLSYNYNNRLSVLPLSVAGEIIDNDQAEIEIKTVNGKEAGSVPAAFEFSFLSGYTSNQDVVIQYTLSGTAAPGSDYTSPSPASITIPAGQSKATLTLPVLDDQIVEGDESITLTVSAVSSVNPVSMRDQSKTLVIEDNDEANITLSNNVSLTEGNDGQKFANFTISIDKAVSSGFSIAYASSDGSAKTSDNDYNAISGSLNFAALEMGPKTISIPVNGDTKFEANESFNFNLGALTGLISSRIKISDANKNRTVTIENDDLSNLKITKVDGKEGERDASFTVGFDPGITTDVKLTVDYFLSGDATAGEDYTGSNGTIEILPGESSKTISLPVINDQRVENQESIKITASVRANDRGITLSNSPQTIIIEDDDKAEISISPVTVSEGNNGTQKAVLEVRLTGATDQGFDLKYSTADGSATIADGDYIAATDKIVHFNGTLNEFHQIEIDVKPDLKIEGDETFEVVLQQPALSYSGALTLGTASATATILNDDSGVIEVTAPTFSENNPAAAAVTFSFPAGVTSDKATRINFKLGGDAKAGEDYTFAGQEWVEIPAGEGRVTLSLPVIDDVMVEEEERVQLTNIALATPSTLITLQNTSLDIALEDNDAAALKLTGPATIDEGLSGTTTATYTVTLDKAVNGPFSVKYATQDGLAKTGDNDYISAQGTLTFNGTAGESFPVTVLINGDKKVESDEDFVLKLSNLSNSYNNRLTIPPANAEVRTVIKNDDTAKIEISKADGKEGSFDASLTFTLSDETISDKETIINYTLSGTAESGKDYVLPLTGSASIAAGERAVTVSIPVVDDDLVENTELINASITVNSFYGFAPVTNLVSINVEDNDQATISILGPVMRPEGNSGTTNFEFEVKLSQELSKTVTLQYKTTDGSATAGSDYTAKTGTLSIKSPADPLKITISVTGDSTIEPDEAFVVSLFNLSDDIDGRIKLQETQATGRILNDDGGDIEITHKDGAEGGDSPEFIFSFPQGVTSAQATTIEYMLDGTAAAGTDFTGTTGSVVIPAGENSVSLKLTVIDDAKVERDEFVELNVTKVDNSMTMANTFQSLTIEDNDVAVLNIDGPGLITETHSGTTVATFTVTLDKETEGGFSVDYQTTDGTAQASDNDYVPKSGSLSFNGTAGETKTFDIVINGDTKIEKDETFSVSLSNISQTFKDNNGADRLGFDARTAIATIKNDDVASIKIETENGEEGVKAGRFVFSLTAGTSDEDIEISYNLTGNAAGAGEDYQGATTGSVTIRAGQTSEVLSLPVIDDAILEDTESVVLTISNVSSPYAIGVADQTKTITITDNDRAAVSISNVSITEGDDGVQLASFNVRLNNATSRDFTIDYATTDGTATVADADYVAKTGSLHFTGEAGEQQVVEVVVNGDRKIESDEVFNLLLSNLSYNYDNRLSLVSSSAKATILNNDQSEIFITTVNGSENGPVAAEFQFSYKPGYSSDKDATIQYTLSGTATKDRDYTDALLGSITIPAGELRKSLVLPVIDDQVVEGTESIRLTVSSVSSTNTTSITEQSKNLTIEDNDELTLTLSGDVTIDEGQDGQRLASFTVTADKEISSGFTLSYTTADQSAKTSDNDYIATDGTLTFTGSANEQKTVGVPVKGDTKIEANELFSFKLGAVSSPLGSRIKIPEMSRTATIKNDDSGNLTITKTDGEEGVKDASFTISFPAGLSADIPLKVEYFLNGDARSNVDYSGASSFINIPAGQNNVTVNLAVIDDAIIEDTEQIELEAKVETNVYGISIPATVLPINIADNDAGILAISPASIKESDALSQTLDFSVTLNKATSKPFTVAFSTADGSASSAGGDYNPQSASLSFAGFEGEVQTIKVVVKDDKVVEATEDLTAKLNSISNTFNNRLSFGTASATGTITDDDFGIIQVSKEDGAEAGSVPAKFTFSFQNGVTSDKATTITYNLTGTAGGNGQDYTAPTTGTITIPAGQSANTLSLPVVDDDRVEGNEEIKILNAISNSPYAAVTLDNTFPVANIADNDNGILSLSADVILTEGNNGTQNATYTLTLNKATNTGFEVAYQTSDGTALATDNDYLPAIGTLTFAGTAGESKTINIIVKGDQKIEGPETFNLELKDPSVTFGGLLSIPEKKRVTRIENDDSGLITITKQNGVEGGQAASFVFSYPAGVVADIPVKIDYSLSGTAQGGNVDYAGSSPASIIIPAGQNNVTLSLPVNDDELVEDTEVVTISASAASNVYNISLANTSETLDILDNDNGRITIDAATLVEGDAGISNLDFKVSLKKGTGRGFTIGYETQDITAKTTDGDYNPAAANASVTFSGTAGETRTISVQVKGDKKIEADETLALILKDLSDNFNGRLVIENSRAIGTIINNDLATLNITKTDGAEAGAVAGTFIFSLPADMTSDQPVVINYALNGTAGGNGVDYTGVTTAAVTIPADQNSVTLTLPVINDAIVEDDETVTISVSSIVSPNGDAITVASNLPVMKIMDDDFGSIAIGASVVKPEGNSGTTSFEFPVTLSKATGLPFKLLYSTSNGTATVEDDDYIPAIDQTLDFAGLAGETQTIKIEVKGDLKLEADELFNVTIHTLSSTFGNKLQITSPSSDGTIKNDDTGSIIVTKTDGTEGVQDAAFTFSFPQNVTSEAPTIINYRLSGTATSADYTAAGVSSITIPAGANSVTLPIKVVDDNELEEVETVSLTINSISNANSVLTWQTPLPIININDNDAADLSITGPAPVIEKHSGKTTVTFTVKLDNLTSKGFEVDFSTTNGSATVEDKDFDAKSGRLTFSGFAGETKQITVDVNGDLKVEGDELFNVLLSNITPSFAGRLTAKNPQASAKILNDDFAPVANPDMITTDEDTPVTQSVIANDTDADGINAATVSIQTYPVKGTLKANPDGTVTYVPVLNDYGTYTFTYTVKDKLGLESNLATATISVLAVNDPPLAGDDVFYASKGTAFRSTVASNDSDVDGDILKFRVIKSPAKGTLDNFNTLDGSFMYMPKSGFAGVDEFSYEVMDPDGLKDTAKVTLNVQGHVTVSLDPAAATITEGDTIMVQAKINDVLLQDVQISLQYGGTATAGKDYLVQPHFNTLTIPAGSTVSTEKLNIQTLKDYLKEGAEQISIRITSANPSAFVTVGNSSTITINDFYPEGKPGGDDENNDIVPDPLLSPNNDGLGNEQFVIRNIERYPDNEVILFNRWGNEVYRTKGYNNADKAFRGVANSGIAANTSAPLAEGVYYFIIHTKTADGDKKNKGYVILKR